VRKLLLLIAVCLDSAAVFLAMFAAGAVKFNTGLFHGAT